MKNKVTFGMIKVISNRIVLMNSQFFRKPLFVIFVFLCILQTNAQPTNEDLAQVQYSKAEESYSKSDYKKCIDWLDKVDAALGTTPPKTQYLRVKAFYGAGDKNRAYKEALLYFKIPGVKKGSEKYNEILGIYVELEPTEAPKLENEKVLQANKLEEDRKAKADAEAKLKSDEKLWGMVTGLNTFEAYSTYLEEYPFGMHPNEAKTRLNDLKPEYTLRALLFQDQLGQDEYTSLGIIDIKGKNGIFYQYHLVTYRNGKAELYVASSDKKLKEFDAMYFTKRILSSKTYTGTWTIKGANLDYVFDGFGKIRFQETISTDTFYYLVISSSPAGHEGLKDQTFIVGSLESNLQYELEGLKKDRNYAMILDKLYFASYMFPNNSFFTRELKEFRANKEKLGNKPFKPKSIVPSENAKPLYSVLLISSSNMSSANSANICHPLIPGDIADVFLEKADTVLVKHNGCYGYVKKERVKKLIGGGFKTGDKVLHKDGRKLQYGEITTGDNFKQVATIKFLNPYGDEKTDEVPYERLSHISSEDYQKNIDAQKIEIRKHKFTMGEKVTWLDDNITRYGEIVALDNIKHDAKIMFLNKYGEPLSLYLDYLKVDKADETKYKEFKMLETIEIEKHKFEPGETVSFVEDKVVKPAEVVALNPSNHKALVKYLNIYGEEHTKDIPYFDIEKMPKEKFNAEREAFQKEIAKYKFVVGEKVSWSKGGPSKNKAGIPCEIVSLDDIRHIAVVKYLDKEGKEIQAKADYLDLIKLI
jgi:hypothetical protein